MYLDDLVSVCHKSYEAGSEPSLFAVEHIALPPNLPNIGNGSGTECNKLIQSNVYL